nr:putative reverse transcriptase domain-containing protein [Tanacetum cinerariifolium]
FWGADEELSDEGSTRVILYGCDGLPMLPVAPPSPDYIPGLEEPQIPPVPHDKDEREPMFIQPYDPDYVPGPMYPEYIPLEDEHVFLAEEQPLPPVVSPTAESPGYVAGLNSEEDPKEYEDDESEDGLVDYPMDGGDNGDDDDGDSSRDDADDKDEQTNNKRKADDLSKNNHGHKQQPAKRQNVAKVYNIGSGERKPYGGNLPKCTKCHFHHNGPCTQKCHKCNKNEKEYEEHLKAILDLLKKEELYAKFSKCVFWISKVQFHGHVIDSR